MNDIFQPKLISCLKNYSKKQLGRDVIAGIIVAIIALPLSIALALASGVAPEQGLYTAITAGFVIALLGGSNVQISGPTAAFATIVAGIVAVNGMSGLVLATLMAGVILILMGVFKFGKLIKFIPFTITTGFTTGIAVTLVIGQLKDFFGLTYTHSPIETMEKLSEAVKCFGTINLQAMLIGLISLAILIFFPKIKYVSKIPPSLIAVIVCAAIVKIFSMDVNTIGSLYEISASLPKLSVPSFSFETVKNVLPDAFTIAILAAIESLLSCVVSDGMIGTKHHSNSELIAQGAGNIVSALFGGIPATGAIARTAANVKNGGRTPISGMVHAVVLLLVLVFFMPYAALIPMPTIAAILFVVAYNMSEWREFVHLVRKSPASDVLVLLTTFVLTVVFDLVVAIAVGIVLAAILFMSRMSNVSDVREWKAADDNSKQLPIPEDVYVFEISGPMFFGASDKLANLCINENAKAIIVRMSGVETLDATAIHKLESFVGKCKSEDIRLIFSHVHDQPMKAMKKSGLYAEIGEENFLSDIESALKYASEITKTY
ncbi:MAG: STAS domain-containing protein [Ruminococcaceae bacterium]|nr:STAS domain-containing protein [Oscillospiraceae bacterium]